MSKSINRTTNDTLDPILDPAHSIAAEVIDERIAQFEKWGPQHPASFYATPDTVQYAKLAEHWKQRNDARVQADRLTWDGILLEEVYEALAETEPTLRRTELIQAAAVCLAEVESIDRLLAETDAPVDFPSRVLDLNGNGEPDPGDLDPIGEPEIDGDAA